MIRQPGRQLAEKYFDHLHSEEYKPMARVLKRLINIFKENECTHRKTFLVTHDFKFKLRFTTWHFKKNTGVSALYKKRLGELTLLLFQGHEDMVDK